MVATRSCSSAAIRELVEDLAEWTEAGDLPQLDLDYLGTAMAGVAFQVATHLAEREPPDVEAAAASAPSCSWVGSALFQRAEKQKADKQKAVSA